MMDDGSGNGMNPSWRSAGAGRFENGRGRLSLRSHHPNLP